MGMMLVRRRLNKTEKVEQEKAESKTTKPKKKEK